MLIYFNVLQNINKPPDISAEKFFDKKIKIRPRRMISIRRYEWIVKFDWWNIFVRRLEYHSHLSSEVVSVISDLVLHRRPKKLFFQVAFVELGFVCKTTLVFTCTIFQHGPTSHRWSIDLEMNVLKFAFLCCGS